jgi:hypothetical protein
MDAGGEAEFALARDAATGRALWRVQIGPIFHDVNGDGPRSTPTVDSELVIWNDRAPGTTTTTAR